MQHFHLMYTSLTDDLYGHQTESTSFSLFAHSSAWLTLLPLRDISWQLQAMIIFSHAPPRWKLGTLVNQIHVRSMIPSDQALMLTGDRRSRSLEVESLSPMLSLHWEAQTSFFL